jgi:hypothetical protein
MRVCKSRYKYARGTANKQVNLTHSRRWKFQLTQLSIERFLIIRVIELSAHSMQLDKHSQCTAKQTQVFTAEKSIGVESPPVSSCAIQITFVGDVDSAKHTNYYNERYMVPPRLLTPAGLSIHITR